MSDASGRAAGSARLEMVDALRGYALMGLFLVHMEEYFELYWSNPSPHLTTTITFGLFMGKTFSLLALCFGFSFFIMMDRAAKRGEPFAGRFAWRLILLLLIGFVHGLVYRGDIIVVLALSGFILIPFDQVRDNRILAIVAGICFLQPYLLLWIFGGSISGLITMAWVQPLPGQDGDGFIRSATIGPDAENTAFGPVEDVSPPEAAHEVLLQVSGGLVTAFWTARPQGTGPSVPIGQIRTVVRAATRGA